MIKRTFTEVNRLKWRFARIISLSRIFNFLLYLIDRIFPAPRAKARPMAVMIEPTNKCNLRCPMCPAVIEGTLGMRPDMTADFFSSVVGSLSSHAFYLALWNYGEPLMNKNIEHMIKRAVDKKFLVEMHTNAQLLDKLTEKAFFNGNTGVSGYLPDKMSISVDSINEETYRYYRKGGELSILKNNVRNFILRRNTFKLSKPWVSVQFILMKNNADEIEDTSGIQAFAKELGVDDYVIKYFSYRGNDLEEYLPTKENLRLKQGGKNTRKLCTRPWNSAVVLSDGTVLPCCYDYSNEWPMGNLNTKSFSEIWNDVPYSEFRASLISGKVPRICINCPGKSFGTLFSK